MKRLLIILFSLTSLSLSAQRNRGVMSRYSSIRSIVHETPKVYVNVRAGWYPFWYGPCFTSCCYTPTSKNELDYDISEIKYSYKLRIKQLRKNHIITKHERKQQIYCLKRERDKKIDELIANYYY